MATMEQLKLSIAGPCPTCAGLGELEATDMFCGAGGSSLGLENVRCPDCGRSLIKVTQALNHWDLAVEAHNANFQHADHDVHDVQEIPASRFRRTEILWASPDCTHHAYCRGPKEDTPEANRSRSTFGDVVRFTAHHRYDIVLVENVIEARLWCDEPSHGTKCSCGSNFNAWYMDMIELGYEGKVIYFNSQFALPTPQSRDRMYVIFWRKGLPTPNLDFTPDAWCSHCEQVVRSVQAWKKASKGSLRDRDGLYEWGRYGSQYVYACPLCGKPAAPAVTGAKTIIDWSIDAQRIGDREKDLAAKTRARIKAGLERLGALDPVTVQVGGNLFERRPGVRVWSVDNPLRTVVGTNQLAVVRYGGQGVAPRAGDEPMPTMTAHDRQFGLVVPDSAMLIQVNRGTAAEPRMSHLDEPTRTVAGHGEFGLVTMRNHALPTHPEEPASSVCGSGNHHGLIVYNGNPGHVRELDEPTGVVKGRDSQALLVPYNRTGCAKTAELPSDTITGRDREALVISEADIDDCLFRMLQWPELLKAQQMHEHGDGRVYELTAKRRDKRGKVRELSNEQRVKMIGNAVSSPVATMLGQAAVEVLAA